jgi:hypothetical protein
VTGSQTAAPSPASRSTTRRVTHQGGECTFRGPHDVFDLDGDQPWCGWPGSHTPPTVPGSPTATRSALGCWPSARAAVWSGSTTGSGSTRLAALTSAYGHGPRSACSSAGYRSDATTNYDDAPRTATTLATRPPARLAVSQGTGSATRMGDKVRTLSSCRLRRSLPFMLLSAGSGPRKCPQPASIRTFHPCLRVQQFGWPGVMPSSAVAGTGRWRVDRQDAPACALGVAARPCGHVEANTGESTSAGCPRAGRAAARH